VTRNTLTRVKQPPKLSPPTEGRKGLVSLKTRETWAGEEEKSKSIEKRWPKKNRGKMGRGERRPNAARQETQNPAAAPVKSSCQKAKFRGCAAKSTGLVKSALRSLHLQRGRPERS